MGRISSAILSLPIAALARLHRRFQFPVESVQRETLLSRVRCLSLEKVWLKLTLPRLVIQRAHGAAERQAQDAAVSGSSYRGEHPTGDKRFCMQRQGRCRVRIRLRVPAAPA